MSGIREAEHYALNYSTDQLRTMVMNGELDPTTAVMAGMMQKRVMQNAIKPPLQTVAAQALTPVAPPQQVASAGIDQLSPGPAAPTPQAMAGGGIVAFDEGGDVSSPAGRVWSGVTDYFSDLSTQAEKARAAEAAMAAEREALRQQVIVKYQPAAGALGAFKAQTPEEYALANQMVGVVANPYFDTAAVKKMLAKHSATASAAPPVAAPPVAAPPVAAPPAAPPVAAPPVAAPPVADMRARMASSKSAGGSGLGSLEADRKSLEETQKQLREAVYPEYKGTEREAELAKRDSGLAGMEKFNIARALMNAGHTIATTNGPYLSGLTAAGKAGFDSYAAGQEKMQAVQDAISKVRAALADAREQGKMKQADEHMKNLGTLGNLQAHLYTADATLRGQDVTAQKYGAATDRAGIQARSEFFKTSANNAKDMINKLRDAQAKAPLASEKDAYDAQIAYYENMARQYMSLWANAEGIKMPKAPPPKQEPAEKQTSMVGQRAAPKQQPT